MKNVSLSLLIILGCVMVSTAQSNPQVPAVNDGENVQLNYAWAGGIDAAQFNAIDINRDGIDDLLVFDRRGNRKLCFINQGIDGVTGFDYDPAAANLFPEFYEWVRLVDYNGDGLKDIFTYSPGYASMMVYKNISDTDLKFELVVYPYLTSLQGSGYVNLFVTTVDYPGIVDIDDDGDLDILSFWGLGSFLEMHQNMSMEKYGNADSLDYMQVSWCWGQFAESDESNQLYLDTCLIGEKMDADPRWLRHTGSTLLFTDLDGNGHDDLVLGDVDFPGLFALYNDGEGSYGHISHVDTLFPNASNPIKLFSMPDANLMDVNNDGLMDLLVGVFDPSLNLNSNAQSCWLYLNDNGWNQPQYQLSTTAFLQEGMIDRGSGAYPVLTDIDGDGLTDLVIGNYGYYMYSYYENYWLRSVFYSRIGYYKNTGTVEEPRFQLWNDDLGHLSQLKTTGLVPAFADLDDDGDQDMIVGRSDGSLIHCTNEGDTGFIIVEEGYQGIDVGQYSTPVLYDLDADGLKDLVIGEQGGNLNYFRNTGTAAVPSFTYVTDSLGKVNVTDYSQSWDGYSVPQFFVDKEGGTRLLCGSERGDLFLFGNIDDNLAGCFTLQNDLNTLLDTSGVSFDRGIRTAGAVGHLKGNSSLQLVAGNYSGGLEIFNASALVYSTVNATDERLNIELWPNPAKDFVHIRLDPQNNEQLEDLHILTLDGKSISTPMATKADDYWELRFDRLPPGSYILAGQVGGVHWARLLLLVP